MKRTVKRLLSCYLVAVMLLALLLPTYALPAGALSYWEQLFGPFYQQATINLGETFTASIVSVASDKPLEYRNNGQYYDIVAANRTGTDAQRWLFTRQPNGSYIIQSVGNAEYFDVLHSSGDAGKGAVTWFQTGNSSQQWFIYEVNGGLAFRPGSSNVNVLTLTDGNTADGTKLQITTYDSTSTAQLFAIDTSTVKIPENDNLGEVFTATITDNLSGKPVVFWNNGTYNEAVINDNPFHELTKLWNFIRQPDGSYKITNEYNYECLDILHSESREGAKLVTWWDTGNVTQRWFLHKMEDGFIIRSAASTCLLSTEEEGTDNLTDIQLKSYNAETGRRFTIVKTQADDVLPAAPVYLGSSFISTITDMGAGKAVDFDAAAKDRAIIRTSDSRLSQYWQFTYQEDGSYEIKNLQNNECLEATAAGKTVGTPIQTYWDNDSKAQRWFIYKIGGRYVFRSKISELVFEVKDGGSADGTPLELGNFRSAISQFFTLNPLPTGLANLGDSFTASLIHAASGKSVTFNHDDKDRAVLATVDATYAQLWQFTRQADGSYEIKNLQNNECLEPISAGKVAGTPVQTYWDNNSKAQRWRIFAVNGHYVLQPLCAQTCMLEVTDGSTADMATLQLGNYNGGDAQLFRIAIQPSAPLDLGESFAATITHVASGRKVGYAAADNAVIADASFANNQLWQFTRQANGSYEIKNRQNNECLEAQGGGKLVGTNVQTYWDNNSKAQRWFIYAMDGNYVLRPANTPLCVLEVQNDGIANGSNLQLGVYEGGLGDLFRIDALPLTLADLGTDFVAKMTSAAAYKNVDLDVKNAVINNRAVTDSQHWRFTRQADGSYKIKNVKSNECLDVSNAGKVAGSNVQTYWDNGSKAQRWFIYKVGDAYALRPACSPECVLETTDRGTEAKTNLQIGTYLGIKTQLFEISTDLTETFYASDNKNTDVGFGFYCINFDKTGTDYKWRDLIQSGYVNTVFCDDLVFLPQFSRHNVNMWLGVQDIYLDVVNGKEGWQKQFDLIWQKVQESGYAENVLGWYLDEPGDMSAVKELTKYAKETYGKRFYICFTVNAIDYNVYGGYQGENAHLTADTAQYLTDIGVDHYYSVNGNEAGYEQLYSTLHSVMPSTCKVWYIPNTFGSRDIASQTAAEQQAAAAERVRHLQYMYEWLLKEPAENRGGLFCFSYQFDSNIENLYGLWNMNQKTNNAWQSVLDEAVRIGTEICRSFPSEIADLGENFTASIQGVASGKNVSYLNNGIYHDVLIDTPSSSNMQRWEFTRQSDGSYKIKNVQNGEYLDPLHGQAINGKDVVTWSASDGANQRWFLCPVNGGYVFRNAADTVVLTVAGGSTENLTNLKLGFYNGTASQVFTVNTAHVTTTTQPTTTTTTTTKPTTTATKPSATTTKPTTTTTTNPTTTPTVDVTKLRDQPGFGYFRLGKDNASTLANMQTEVAKGHINTHMVDLTPQTFDQTLNALRKAKELGSNQMVWLGVADTIFGFYASGPVYNTNWEATLSAMMRTIEKQGLMDQVLGFYFDEPLLCGIKKADFRDVTKYLRETYPSLRVMSIFATNAINPKVWSNGGNDQVLDYDTTQYLTDAGYDMYWDVNTSRHSYETLNASLKNCFKSDVRIWFVPCIMSYCGKTDEAYALAHLRTMYEFLLEQDNPGGLFCYAYDIFNNDGIGNIGYTVKQAEWTKLEKELIRIGKEILAKNQ